MTRRNAMRNVRLANIAVAFHDNIVGISGLPLREGIPRSERDFSALSDLMIA